MIFRLLLIAIFISGCATSKEVYMCEIEDSNGYKIKMGKCSEMPEFSLIMQRWETECKNIYNIDDDYCEPVRTPKK